MSTRFDFTEFPRLKTERLLLREITFRDTEAVFRIRGDYRVTRHNIGAAYQSVAEARRLVEEIRKSYRLKTELRWGITLLGGENTVIGMCGYNFWQRTDQRASLGYDLAFAYWGQGMMREAAAAILHFGFERMDLNRIEADVGAGNTASIKLLDTLGFQHEGTQREHYYEEEEFHDLRLYGLLRREWDLKTGP
ncbi:MAG: GNAT family N-acetyltransferase [Cytophagales bacterium]|nr:GNAT family N-acetyltransferase [Armatimonadota bacterium]